MPPQTHLTAEIVRDAAPLVLDRPISVATNAARDAQAAPRSAAPIAVLRNLSEKEAAAPPGDAAPGLFSLVARYWQAFQDARRQRKLRVTLRDLSEAQLIDIGLARSDIDYLAAHRALEKLKDSTAHLMMSRGVM
ncbi:DUF1127 domain-containing protein [Bradyrhizobium sp. HKCCYLS20291]|uniref:DUF1127 domain-containing protein n=1 Tax=Bradyrhizobium sp. HKCCYLS20291 TaxID=3420766 RepID=UPI003EBEAD10